MWYEMGLFLPNLRVAREGGYKIVSPVKDGRQDGGNITTGGEAVSRISLSSQVVGSEGKESSWVGKESTSEWRIDLGRLIPLMETNMI